MEKLDLKVGDKVYLRQFTGRLTIDMIKRPYTVIEVSPKIVKVQACQYIWPVYHCSGNPRMDRPDLEGKRVCFFDTMPEAILPDPDGFIKELTWHSKRKLWGTKGRESDYPAFAIKTDKYEYVPYLD